MISNSHNPLGLSEPDWRKYCWRYGKIGQILVEKSDHIRRLLKKGYKTLDGHGPILDRFSNLSLIEHVDIVIYDHTRNLVKGICEVKTTKTKDREFDSNGRCAEVMSQAGKNRIPLYFAVVRLSDFLPRDILTDDGYVKVLKRLLTPPPNYEVEFYSSGEFELRNGKFKIHR